MEARKESALALTAFVQLCLKDQVLDEYEVRSAMSIGRSPECDIVIDNAAVSGFHAMMNQVNGRLIIEDAVSTNGVMTDGVKKKVVELKPYESVQIAGKYSLRLIDAPTQMPKEKTKTAEPEVLGETMLVSTSTLAKVGQSTRPAYLTLSKAGQAGWLARLEKPSTFIGRKRSCDIRVGGWFSPGVLARIERQDDGFYLTAEKTNRVTVDGQSVSDDCRLEEGQRLQFGDVSGVFHERTNIKHG